MEDGLKAKGWHLTSEGIDYCIENGNRNIDNVIQNAKDIDLKEIGEKWLPEELSRGKCDYVQGPGVVQIQKIRNVSAPKENEESQYAPRLLKLTFTDGKMNCGAIEMEKIDKISLDTPPGTKICLKGTIGVEHGFLMLSNKNTVFIGGRVQAMADSWELKKLLSKQTRGNVGREGGPPPFVPFGTRIRENKPQQVVNKRDNFKSLENTTKKTEDAEFEQQRQATIAEALQAKDDGKAKTFGSQKQAGKDQDVARIVEMGFSVEDANSALRQSNGNVNDAIHSLLGGNSAPQNRQGFQRDRQGPPYRDERKVPVKDDRRDNYKGGRGKNRDEDFVVEDTKPSAPATLFDFLETKIKPSKDDKESTKKTDQTSKYVQSKSSYNSESKSQGQQQSYNQYQDHRNQGQGQRNKPQNVPPRFNRSAREGTSNSYSSNKQSDYHRSYSANQNGHTGNTYNDRTSRQNSDSDRTNKSGRQQYSNSQRGDNYDSRTSRNYENNYDRNSRDQGNKQYRPKSSQNYDRRQNSREDYQDQRRERGSNYDQRERGSNYDQRERGGNYDQRERGSNYYDQQRDNRNQNREYQNRNQRYENKENYDQRGGGGRNYPPPQQQQPPPPPPPQVPPQQQQQQQQQYFQQPEYQQPTFVQPQPIPRQWNRGEMCMAKYWEDNKFYTAVVEVVAPELPTCVVTFVEYGNTEEVRLTDLKPLPTQTTYTTQGQYPGNYGNPNLPQQQATVVATSYAPAYATVSQYQTGNPINTMEFRRRPDQNESRRPTQQYYQPPIQEYQQ